MLIRYMTFIVLICMAERFEWIELFIMFIYWTKKKANPLPKGNGFVLEQGYNETAAQAQLSSGFNQAFADQKYVAYAAQNVYLNDNNTFIEKPSGFSTYVCTLRYENSDYGVRTYPESGIVYCDTNADRTDKRKLAVSTSDHGINYVMLRSNDSLVNLLRFYFDKGCFRFKNLKCKEAILKAISY